MIILMRHDHTEQDVEGVLSRIREGGFRSHLSRGQESTIVGVVGDDRRVANGGMFESLAGVAECVRVLKPYKLASLDFHPEPTVVKLGAGPGAVTVGGSPVVVMAGPCAVEDWTQLKEAAEATRRAGARVLRGGAFKPRTSPYSFQGLGEEGLVLLARARELTGMPVVTEVMTPELVPLVSEYADCLQIGARNTQNYNLLQACGKASKPVLLKRGVSGTIEELLMAAEYVLAHGNPNVILCERGIRTFEKSTRNTLDISAVPLLKELTHLPVIVDPSHGTGKRSLVIPMAKAAVAAGADGLIVEVHPDPQKALSDGAQSLTPRMFDELMSCIGPLAEAIGRSVA